MVPLQGCPLMIRYLDTNCHGPSWNEMHRPINVIHRYMLLARLDELKEQDVVDERGIGNKLVFDRQSGGSCASCILEKSPSALVQDKSLDYLGSAR